MNENTISGRYRFIKGIIEKTIFREAATDYTIIRMLIEGIKITASGEMHMPQIGALYTIYGDWNHSNRYGKVFKFKRYLPDPRWATHDAFVGLIPNQSGVIIKVIVNCFGDKTFDVLENEPERLCEVAGIGPKRAQAIHDDFMKMIHLKESFQQYGVDSFESENNRWNLIELNNSKLLEGVVYVMTNELMPGVVKIGFTAGNPEIRANRLSEQHGLPSRFMVAGYERTKDPYFVEQKIHNLLRECHVSGEFFKCEVEYALSLIHEHKII